MSASVNSRPARHLWIRPNVRFDDSGVRFPDIPPQPTCSKHRTLLKNRPGASTRNVARKATARTQPPDVMAPTLPPPADGKSPAHRYARSSSDRGGRLRRRRRSCRAPGLHGTLSKLDAPALVVVGDEDGFITRRCRSDASPPQQFRTRLDERRWTFAQPRTGSRIQRGGRNVPHLRFHTRSGHSSMTGKNTIQG
jgi:hypothetical protein